jgi:hypothetical protein
MGRFPTYAPRWGTHHGHPIRRFDARARRRLRTVAPPAVRALDPAAECALSKRRSAGKKANGKLKCAARAAGLGSTVDWLCLDKQEDKFLLAYGQAENPGAAASSSATLRPWRRSSTPEWRICLGNVGTSFIAAFARAELGTDCLTTTDAALVEADVDQCLSTILGAEPAPTTTTTTTTSTTTTTVGACTSDPEAAAVAGVTAAHNAVRANATPAPSPPLAPLCYDSALQTIAQTWANNCIFQHNVAAITANMIGENIHAEAPFNSMAPLDAVTSWASEAADYNYATNTCAPSQVCGHYTQIVWRNTNLVGCGVRNCTTNSPFGPSFPNWTLVVCDYSPWGNIVGEWPY